MKNIADLAVENETTRRKVGFFEAKIDEAEQYSRRNSVEIHGIPQINDEKVVDLVKKVGRALDYPIEDNIIYECHCLWVSDWSAPGIIVKFIRGTDCEALLKCGREKKDFSTRNLGLPSHIRVGFEVGRSL